MRDVTIDYQKIWLWLNINLGSEEHFSLSERTSTRVVRKLKLSSSLLFVLICENAKWQVASMMDRAFTLQDDIVPHLIGAPGRRREAEGSTNQPIMRGLVHLNSNEVHLGIYELKLAASTMLFPRWSARCAGECLFSSLFAFFSQDI